MEKLLVLYATPRFYGQEPGISGKSTKPTVGYQFPDCLRTFHTLELRSDKTKENAQNISKIPSSNLRPTVKV